MPRIHKLKDRYYMTEFRVVVTKEDESISKIVKKFVDREIMPLRDKIDDDKDHNIVNNVFKKLHLLGFDAGVAIKDSYRENGAKFSYVTSSIIIEELSRGDVGIGIVSAINGWALLPAYVSNNEAVLALYEKITDVKNPVFTCFAMTEEASGCDIENIPLYHGKVIKTTAVLNNGSWVINGTKVFASNAGIASLYCVVCRTPLAGGGDEIALIYVPDGTEGISYGAFEVKAGLQADRNASIYLENVRVPVSYRAGGDNTRLFVGNLTVGRVATAAAAVGCAKGIFEEVLKYTGDRKVGGKCIRDHSIAAGILAEMITGIETARCYYLNVAYMLSNPDTFGPADSEKMLSFASICKNYATETAITVANKAMELMGSYGYIRGYHVEKYWRDIKELQLWLGGVQLGKFDIVRGYYQYQTTNG